MSKNECCKCWPSWALAHLLLRLWVGLRLFMAGLDKFRSGSGAAAEFTLKNYEKKMGVITSGVTDNGFLPMVFPGKMTDFAFQMFRNYLGWALMIVGGLIIIGLFRRLSIFMGG